MSYAIISDIESEFKRIDFSAVGTGITSAQVQDFLDQTDALIDMNLLGLYILPIDVGATESLLILKKIEIDFVSFRVAEILEIKNKRLIGDDKILQEISKINSYRESQKLLLKIKLGQVSLPDAAQINMFSGLGSYNSKNSVCPKFSVDDQQW